MRYSCLFFTIAFLSSAIAQERFSAIQFSPSNPGCRFQTTGKFSSINRSLDFRAASDDSIDALHYELELDLDPLNESLTGQVDIVIRSLENNLADFDLSLAALTVDSVKAASSPLSFYQSGNQLHIDLAAAINIDDTVRVTIAYHGFPQSEPGPNSWGGFYFEDGNAYNLGAGLNTTTVSMLHYWVPCHDEPWDKASFDLTLTGPLGKTIASIGLLQSVVSDTVDSTVTYRWIEDHQTSTYLVALAMYDYVVLEQTLGDTLPVAVYVWPQDSSDAVIHFEHLPDMVDYFSSVFGPYMFDKVGYAATSRGAMEHQTLVSYPGGVIGPTHGRDWLIAHELAHMWWGDWVTVADWRDIWLNEGFATYSEALFVEDFFDRATYDVYMRDMMSAYFSGIGGEGDFPIYDPQVMWGVHSYQKGGIVLHMLRHVIGDSLFFATLDNYGQAFAFSNATTEDFQNQAEAASGLDLDWFFQQWIYGPSFPVYEFAWTVDSVATDTFAITCYVHQVREDSLLFDMPMEVLFKMHGGDSLVEFRMSQHAQGIQLLLPGLPTSVEIDPGNLILDRHSQVDFVPFAVIDYSIDDSEGGDGDGNAEPGETVVLAVEMHNIAYSAGNISAILASNDTSVTVLDSSGNYGFLEFDGIGSNSTGGYQISIDADAGLHSAAMELTFYINGYSVATIPFGLNVYTQQVAFIEGFEFGTAKWDLNGGWQPYFWAHSGGQAITDSPTGYYAHNSFSPLLCRKAFDLSASSSASLSFYHVYQFNSGDSGLVQIKNSGEGWQTVESYSGMPAYEWSQAAINLTDYCGPGNDSLQVRFVLKSDDASVSDGWYIDDIVFTVDSVITVAADDFSISAPTEFKLSQNYPNPFNPLTTIEYHLPMESQVEITVYNLAGQAVAEIADQVQPAGIHTVNFNASALASGLYFYRITAGDFTQTKKMVVLK